jgi:hypothetical protein
MLLTVSSFGESLRRLSTGGGVFNKQVGSWPIGNSRLYRLLAGDGIENSIRQISFFKFVCDGKLIRDVRRQNHKKG